MPSCDSRWWAGGQRSHTEVKSDSQQSLVVAVHGDEAVEASSQPGPNEMLPSP